MTKFTMEEEVVLDLLLAGYLSYPLSLWKLGWKWFLPKSHHKAWIVSRAATDLEYANLTEHYTNQAIEICNKRDGL